MKLEDFVAVVIIGMLIAGFVTFLAQMTEADSHDTCHERGNLAQVKVTYRKWDDCYVYYHNAWMPYDIWKYNRDHGIVVK